MLAITIISAVGILAGWQVARVASDGMVVTDHDEMVRLARSFRYGCGVRK